jgi:hypothetical protein
MRLHPCSHSVHLLTVCQQAGVLRPVCGVTVSTDGRDSTDYYDPYDAFSSGRLVRGLLTPSGMHGLLMFTSRWKPPTFTRLDSAAHLRWWFPHNPTRSLRDPERHQGTRLLPSALQMNLMQPLGRQIAVICLGTPIGVVRCLVDSGHHSGLCRV